MWYYQQALAEVPDVIVKTASKVDDVFDMLEKHQPDLVVLDIMMDPGETLRDTHEVRGGLCTGLVLAERIRKQYRNLPIVLLSNAVAPEAPQRGMATVLEERNIVDEVFYKPKTSPFHFRDIVLDIINERAAEEAS